MPLRRSTDARAFEPKAVRPGRNRLISLNGGSGYFVKGKWRLVQEEFRDRLFDSGGRRVDDELRALTTTLTREPDRKLETGRGPAWSTGREGD